MFPKSNASIKNKDKFKSLLKYNSSNYRLKSKIKMNKQKLIQIIVKDLDELKILTQEIAESQDDSPIFIELALSRANLICQEYKLLRKFSEHATPQDDSLEEDEDEVSDLHFSDPDLEILNFEPQEATVEKEVEETNIEEAEEDENTDEQAESEVSEANYPEPEFEISTSEEMKLDEEEEVNHEEEVVYDSEEEEDEDINEETNDDEIPEELLEDETEDPDDVLVDFEDETEDNDTVIEEETNQETIPLKATSQLGEQKTEHTSGIREIHMEDLDDDENDPMQFAPAENKTSRPVMREIPRPEMLEPENPSPEKLVVGETFQKERSLNDAIGENKSAESSLGNGPISSLRAAIGLNDRFLFIREIFANNTDKYNMIIDQLDKLETIQQAVEYLKANLTLEKNQTSLKFVELLKRRFNK